MNLTLKNISRISSAILILFMVLMKPVHQLNHLQSHSENSEQQHTDGNSVLQSSDVCMICDFQISPSLEISFNSIYIPVEFAECHQTDKLEVSKKLSTYSGLNKNFRAPPFKA